jgi:hypothetical protein
MEKNGITMVHKVLTDKFSGERSESAGTEC